MSPNRQADVSPEHLYVSSCDLGPSYNSKEGNKIIRIGEKRTAFNALKISKDWKTIFDKATIQNTGSPKKFDIVWQANLAILVEIISNFYRMHRNR